MEFNRDLALALFGILVVCAAAFIFLGASSDADWAIPILGGGKGVEYELHPSSGIDQSVYGVGENGTLLEEISIEEQYLLEEGSQEPFDYQSQPHSESQESVSFGGEGPEEPPVEDLCKMLGLASENCQDDNETVRLQDLDGEELSFQPVYFSPDLSHQAKSSAESSIRRKLVLSNVSETELTDLTFIGEGGEVILKEVPLSEIIGEAELSKAVMLRHNNIGIDSQNYPELNMPARIKFTGVYGLKDAYPLRNGEPCGDYCSDFRYDHRTGKASMDVSGFSNYSIGGINITYAEHLDSEYNFISDITADVKDKDNVWSEEIPVGHFVRAGFEENLTNGKLMDIYVRKGGADNVYFNVYEKGTTAPLLGASGPLAVEGGWVYIILENLAGEADTFDFKIMGDSGGYAEFDYIHDDDVSGCTNISYSGEYTLTQNLTGAPNALDFEYPFNVDNACIIIESSDVILDCSGYSINNDGTDNATAIAINGSTSGGLQNITIRNCPGINGYRTGFSSEHSSGIELGDSNFTNNTNGITIANTTYSRFTNLSIQDGGIHLYYGSNHNNITDLTSLDSGSYSVYLEESSYNRITRLFSGNASIHGIQMQDESLENLVHNSTINNSAGYGIQVANSTATLTNNIISVSGFSGLEIVGADVNASHNLIYDNTAGINARTFNAYEVQTYLVGYNNTLYDSSLAELYFEGDTNYTNINLTNTSILPSSGLYTTHSVIDIHDVVAPGKEYSIKWATGPASFGGYPDTYINASFKYKFLNITSDSAQAIDRLVWHWNSSEASGHQESKFRIVQNASSADRTIFPELPDTENRTFTLDSLQLYAQEDNFGIFEERLNCIEPYNDLYINESTYLCEGWYNIADAGATGTVILNANNIEVVCPNNNVTINGTGAGVGFYILGGSGKGQNITLANCSAERYAEGIRVTATGGSVTRNKLIGNTILDCPIGIYLDNANNNNGNFVANNTIKRATSGIRLYREDNTVLANNDIRDSTYGFWLTDSSNYNLIASNYIQNMSEYGIRLRHSATDITNVDYNTFENNTIVDALYGIGFVPTGNALARYNNVTNNEINNTTYGIYISSNRATGNNFTENRINNATYGVFFESGFTTDTSQNYFQCENYYEGEKFCHFYDVHNAVFEDYYGSPGYVGNESNDATNLGMITIRDSSNFTFSNLNLSKDRNYGFASMYSDDIHVLDSIFSGNGATNAFLFGTKNNSFINTTFKDTEQGILLGPSSSTAAYAVTGTTISGSRIENSSVYGIHFRAMVENTLIEGSSFIDNPTHIAFVNANNYYSQISNNSFSGGDYGVFYNRIADVLYTYRYHNLTGNTAENISDTCYYIRSAGNGYHDYEYFNWSNNNCTNATYGYYLRLGDYRTRFRHNVFDTANFQDVEYGLYIYLGVAQTASIPATTIENNTYSNFDINATVFPVTFWINSITSGVHKMEHALNNFTLRNDPESDFIENNRPAFTYINTTNITFHRNLGSISFPYLNFDATNSIRSTNTMLGSDIASIDSAVHTYFQAEANISMYSNSCPAEIYWKDGFPTSSVIISATGSPCPGDRCYNTVCMDNIVNFTVSNFSGYTANVTGIPSVENVTLNSTFGTNYTSENLTVWYDITSPGGLPVKNITNWYVDGISLTNLNFPFVAYDDSVVQDYSPYSINGTPNNVFWNATMHNGRSGYYFNTSTSYIKIDDPGTGSPLDSDTFTLEVWANPDSTPASGLYELVSKIQVGGYSLGLATNGRAFMRVRTGTAYRYLYTNNDQVAAGDWHHIVGTYTHSTREANIYINGTLKATTIFASGTYGVNNHPVCIGAQTSSGGCLDGENFPGQISLFRFWNRTLTAEQVAALYTDYEANTIVSQETNVGEEWQACVTPNNGHLDGLTNCSNNLTIRDLPMPIIENVTLNSTFGTNYTTENLTVYYDAYAVQGLPVKNITNWFVDDTSITVLNMPFEATGGNESTWTRDYSPYGNNGTVHGAVWGSDSGQDGWGAYEFTKASSQYISIPDDASFDITDEMSIEVRVKFKTKSTNQGLVYKGAFTNSWGPWALSYIQSSSPNGIYFNINNFALTTITPDISVDTWYHIVATYDGQNMSIYMDGELEDTNSFASPTQINTDSNPVRLGSYYGTSTNRYLDGSMDTVRIYNRALTPEQVQMLYHNQTDSISWNETEVGETWKACITPNDGNLPGLTNCSNNIIIKQEPETCPVFSTPGVHELEMEAIGAKNTVSGITGITDACIVITSSDVILDCAGFNITNDGTGSAAGIFANTSATNITIRNCPKISGYSHGVSISNAGSGEIQNIVSENNQQGIVIQQSTGFTVSDSEIRGNSVRGVLFNNSGNIFLLNSHLYNNTYDLEVSEDAGTPSPFNATNVIFDRPEGDYQSFTNLSINDTAQSYAYTITWMDGLPPEPTGYVSFRQKYINISTSAGAPSINYISWHWTGAEIAGYNQSEFELWEYSSGGWSSLNNTPDIVAQALSLSGLSPSSGYGILQKNVTELTVYLNEPSNGHLTTSTTITFNCSAASPEPLVNITLYGNWSGGWHANETKPLSGTYDSASFTRTLPLGTYEWNCLAFDSTDNSDWADANYTFTILNATDDLYALHGANVTVLNTSKYNGSDVGGTYELQGGNLTGADFHMRVSTEKWAGMYGNLTAKLILSEGSDTVFMYAWNWTPENGGEVCLTQNTGPFWTAMEPTQKSHIDTAFGYNPSDSDSANNTLTDASVLISVANTSSPTTGVHLGANSTFEMGAFQFIPNPAGEADFAFCVNLSDGVAYQNNSVHFELVVPTTEEKGPGPLETYYVYVELH